MVFTADHGLAVGNHGLMGKQNLHGHSTCAPLIIRAPVPNPTVTRSTLVYIQDVHPTFIELAGGENADDGAFTSLVPLMRGDVRRVRDEQVLRFSSHLLAVRLGPWKAIWRRDLPLDAPGAVSLYNVADDPHELRDRASDPDAAEIRDKLMQRLHDLASDPAGG